MEVTQAKVDDRIAYVQRVLAAVEVPDVRIKAATNLAFSWLAEGQRQPALAAHRATLVSLVDLVVDRRLSDTYSGLEPLVLRSYPEEEAHCYRARIRLLQFLGKADALCAAYQSLGNCGSSTRDTLIECIKNLVTLRSQILAIDVIAKNRLKIGVDNTSSTLLRDVLHGIEPFEQHRAEVRKTVLAHVRYCAENNARPLAWELMELALNAGVLLTERHLPKDSLKRVIEQELRNRDPDETLRFMQRLGKLGWSDSYLWQLTLNRFAKQGTKTQLLAIAGAAEYAAEGDLADAACLWALRHLISHSHANSRKLLEHPDVDYSLPRTSDYRKKIAVHLTNQDPKMRHCALWTRLWQIDNATEDRENLLTLNQYADLYPKVRDSGHKATAISLALNTLYDRSRLAPEGKSEQFLDWCVLHQRVIADIRTLDHLLELEKCFNTAVFTSEPGDSEEQLNKRSELLLVASRHLRELANRLHEPQHKSRVHRLLRRCTVLNEFVHNSDAGTRKIP